MKDCKRMYSLTESYDKYYRVKTYNNKKIYDKIRMYLDSPKLSSSMDLKLFSPERIIASNIRDAENFLVKAFVGFNEKN